MNGIDIKTQIKFNVIFIFNFLFCDEFFFYTAWIQLYKKGERSDLLIT